mmetsp:Transcript_40285/g.60427  ORF Transcript_40285/g.60427 Transcript_40285/m.60427 type:complete len:416 (-) Transcript_40285:227-1474(-)
MKETNSGTNDAQRKRMSSTSTTVTTKRLQLLVVMMATTLSSFQIMCVSAFSNPTIRHYSFSTTTTTTALHSKRQQKGAKRNVFHNIRNKFFASTMMLRSSSNNNENQQQQQQKTTARQQFSPTTQLTLLQQENEILRESLQQLQQENRLLQQERGTATEPRSVAKKESPKVIIETFEGEEELDAWYSNNTDIAITATPTTTAFTTNDEDDDDDELCDPYDSDACPVEPDVSFTDAFKSRAYWLVGLLALQSCSGFILARNEELLQAHPVIVYFLTMLVGAGGNAGNQASVRVIRGLALGTLNDKTQRRFLSREFKMALSLSSTLSLAGFARALIVRTPIPETIAITSALTIIVFSSICLGAILPLGLKRLGVDPAHSSTTIQVVMDILGVLLTVLVSTSLLDSGFGKVMMMKLGL